MSFTPSTQVSLRRELDRVANRMRLEAIAGTPERRAELESALEAAQEAAKAAPAKREQAQKLLDEATQLESAALSLQRRLDEAYNAQRQMRELVPQLVQLEHQARMHELRASELGHQLRSLQTQKKVWESVAVMSTDDRQALLHCQALAREDPSHVAAPIDGEMNRVGFEEYRAQVRRELPELTRQLAETQAEYEAKVAELESLLDM